MGFHNPPVPWSEIERTLSDRRRPRPVPAGADGGDSPAWSHKRGPYVPPAIDRPADTVPYAELHAHSSYSFLDGASSPEELAEEAERLGLHALAVTDHDGFYGIVRFAEAAEALQLGTVFGAELSLELPGPQNGEPDPVGSHLLVLARGEEGYHRLAAAITAAQLRGAEKGRPVYDLDELAERSGGPRDPHWAVLTGCRKGTVRRALAEGGADAAAAELDRLVGLFGQEAVHVELMDHGNPLDSRQNDVLAALAAERRLPVLATNNVHYAAPERELLAAAVAAVRANRGLDEIDGWLPAHAGAHLRSGAEMARRFARYPGAVSRTVTLADELAFPLRRAKPALPKQQVPEGHTPMTWLRHLVWEAVPRKYPDLTPKDRDRIERELAVIEMKDFPGYFLIVHGIVQEARRRGILCQGRGSAANSAVCFLLDITAVDSIAYDLPFERFLSSLRDEEPDIDVDFDSDRREEIIQWVYREYGRDRAAQVANVIQYRPKNAVRDMAKALGHSPGQQDAWSKQVERWGAALDTGADHDIPDQVLAYATELLKAPRHLGIHSGGMVLTDRPVGEVVPIEHARMEDRTVIQWDKDDAAWMGLVKFDLLGLGMLAALQYCFDLIRDATGEEWELATIPKEEKAVYDMLCRADSIGVFQVESRAQMGLLPRLQPRRFYDLVVQIALVRPGPIQGGAVHPFVRRKLGQEKVTYAHEKLRPVLERTMGVPVFQEQLMQMAVAVGDCTAEDADLLRRAMGSKRGVERIEKLREKLYAGMARNGLTGEVADSIYDKIQAFANFGFAESHSLSFALLVYASSWIKLHYPAAFLAGLLRAQPMGFYSPATLSADARRHGVEVRRPDLLRSGVEALLEPHADSEGIPGTEDAADRSPRFPPTGRQACAERVQPPVGDFDPTEPDESEAHRRDGRFAVRLGLAAVTGIGTKAAERIVAEREASGPYRDLRDLVRRTGLTAAQLEALATAGAFECLGITRREAIWSAGSAAQDRAEYLPESMVSVQPPLFPDPTSYEVLAADLWATGISPGDHPLAHYRSQLDARGVLTSRELRTHENGRRVEVAGLVTHRQRPATASGITFLNLEDEHGLVNVICSVGVWDRHRRIVRESPALIVRGILERSVEGVTNLVADRFDDLRVGVAHSSRDFR
ncbi:MULTISPECIES: error-prone DNA polymerase [Microbacterium]|uniref:Error-prone DNA polymerase n=1 Tax=Microbacterium wangchenii TaxID=2541726 RepID=A0ABX5STM3_9MICO|nr:MULTISPECIES: error-prone DNA polymerase [Microbacterium]MCK6067569.1 error-prone DNA polymerase [Microbacterium sp. EYE_512]QBR89506.1 error-prone DNA polymerase [Microbacterium wangchenii]TFV80854.1 error-prone DNA polymerase [Microbacterium sp. dk485]TXK16896.1 error-prone DNA polymerase [Microbacterium wangchenii]